jgi:hypothetical protein
MILMVERIAGADWGEKSSDKTSQARQREVACNSAKNHKPRRTLRFTKGVIFPSCDFVSFVVMILIVERFAGAEAGRKIV